MRGLLLVEEEVASYVKDYDDYGGPATWGQRFDLTQWGMISAFHDEKRIGGVVIACGEPTLVLAGNWRETAVVWDLRLEAFYRGKGIGSQLFREAEIWAKSHACKRIEIETQNTNLNACKLYKNNGCELVMINRNAYREWPGEVQLVWEKPI